jgi:hypothetical protein
LPVVGAGGEHVLDKQPVVLFVHVEYDRKDHSLGLVALVFCCVPTTARTHGTPTTNKRRGRTGGELTKRPRKGREDKESTGWLNRHGLAFQLLLVDLGVGDDAVVLCAWRVVSEKKAKGV